MNNINILFYSNHCECSKLLITMFQNENLLKYFYKICTDNNPKVPSFIKVTPTIIIRGFPEPYVAADAFVWLAKIKQYKVNATMQRMNATQQQYINSNLEIDKTNILGFVDSEMNGTSDIYSFFSKNIAQECQESLPQTFFDYDKIGQENIFTPPLESGSYKMTENYKKLGETEQNKLYNDLKMKRCKQDDAFGKSNDSFIKSIATQNK